VCGANMEHANPKASAMYTSIPLCRDRCNLAVVP
jgi:hypothetical protein